MSEMSRIERVLAVADGQQPDRPPVSFWYHLAPDEVNGTRAVEAHLRHLTRYDLDFLKVMNDNGYPQRPVISAAADLHRLEVLTGDEAEFAAQIELIQTLTRELSGKVLLVTTLFNAWTTLRKLLREPVVGRHNPPTLGGAASPADRRLSELLAEDRAAVGEALEVIAESLANFARRCVEAGADGVFLSVRDDWVDTEAHGRDTYAELVRRGDLRILAAAAAGRFNLLHVCGVPRGFEAFCDYPVAAINWADRAAGPAIADVIGRIKPAVCGGVDNLRTLPQGSPQDVEDEVRETLRQAGGCPMIVAPGCTFDPEGVPEANLDAMVRAARGQG